FFIHFAGHFRVIDREWQDIGHVQHLQLRYGDFDFTRRNLRVIRAGWTRADLAGDTNDTFAAESRGLFEEVFRQIRRIENSLGAALAVADINKNQAAQVAAGVDPTGKGNNLADMRRPQFVAMMRSFHSVWNSKQNPKRTRMLPRERAEFNR